MKKNKLNPIVCEILASILGALNPKAEKSYRQSLVVIDSNPKLCTLLQGHAFVLAGIEIAKIRRPRK
jgi:hypothetical protein